MNDERERKRIADRTLKAMQEAASLEWEEIPVEVWCKKCGAGGVVDAMRAKGRGLTVCCICPECKNVIHARVEKDL